MIQSLRKWMARSLVALSVLTVLACAPQPVHADNYGSGLYNSDVYGSSSSSSGGGSSSGSSSSSSSSGSGSTTPGSRSGASSGSSSPTAESTVVQTDSGLQVAINLADGQAIPSSGYYITVTPLNGQGKTFDKVEIYLDGVLAYTGTPDSTGTLRWFWDASKNPATKVKIIVFGPGSGTTTHEFNVTVTPVQATNTNNQQNTPTNTPQTAGGWPAWIFWAIGVVVVVLVIWLILAARRRRQNQQVPPP